MNLKTYTAICLSLSLAAFTQGTQAAAMKKTTKVAEAPLSFEKPQSPIEKALSQQKRDRIAKKAVDENDQIKAMTNLKYAPTQNFLADQHQRFSRFVQSIFPQHTS